MHTGKDNPDEIPYQYKLAIGFVHCMARVLDKIYEGKDSWERNEPWFWVLND